MGVGDKFKVYRDCRYHITLEAAIFLNIVQFLVLPLLTLVSILAVKLSITVTVAVTFFM
jgi:hypothetical protein